MSQHRDSPPYIEAIERSKTLCIIAHFDSLDTHRTHKTRGPIPMPEMGVHPIGTNHPHTKRFRSSCYICCS